MEEVHFKFDVSAKIPFQIRLNLGDRYLFRRINSNDGILYNLAPQATQNILYLKGFQKGKLIFKDLYQSNNMAEYGPPLLSRQIYDEFKNQKKCCRNQTQQKFQIQNYSQIFLSIVIHENERFIELDDMRKIQNRMLRKLKLKLNIQQQQYLLQILIQKF